MEAIGFMELLTNPTASQRRPEKAKGWMEARMMVRAPMGMPPIWGSLAVWSRSWSRACPQESLRNPPTEACTGNRMFIPNRLSSDPSSPFGPCLRMSSRGPRRLPGGSRSRPDVR
jgi:hypothetical protein